MFSFLTTIPMTINIDRVLLTSAQSKYFLLTYQLVTHYLIMWVLRNAKMIHLQEYFDMLMVLGECRKHYWTAQDLYAARYPDRQKKCAQMSHFLVMCFFLMKLTSQIKKNKKRTAPINGRRSLACSVSRFETGTLHTQRQQQYVRENGCARSAVRLLFAAVLWVLSGWRLLVYLQLILPARGITCTHC